jgi:origin recognition complex subunit 1
MARLVGTESFKSDAVQLVARKVAAVSGDARRALDICRRATEIAEETTKGDRKAAAAVVTMVHVQKSLEEMISSAKVQAIKSCSKMEQLFLEAVTNEVSRFEKIKHYIYIANENICIAHYCYFGDV